jgi:hypothetical protein
MIPSMCRKIIAALVIVGWISLSVFDVVEDLDEVPGQASVSTSSPDDGTSKRGGWGPLANNIVESANQIKKADDIALVSFIPIIFEFLPVLDFRKHSQLHKLFRVFLI